MPMKRSGDAPRRGITSRTPTSVALAVVVGIAAGGGAVAFRWMIRTVHDGMFGAADALLPALGEWRVVPVPALGGLLVGLLVFYLAEEARGSGIPEVMLAVARHGGRIRARVSFVKALSSSICIGSGGSAGREGPIVQIGASLASSLAQALRLPPERTRLLAACGSAAGVAATFNAPIGGALFASEVILRDFGVRSFSLVVLAAVVATAFSRAAIGDFPAFRVPAHPPTSWAELPIFALMGVLAAVVGFGFKKLLYATTDAFDALPVPRLCRPVIGGLLVGLIGVNFPRVFGVGYDTIEPALRTELSLLTCAGLVLLKTLATSITIGSGGSGGVFAPSLYIGAVLGSLVGQCAALLAPGMNINPGSYAIAGMGAVFTGAAHAPVSSVLILFEMTADYRVIVPLMAAIVVSAMISEYLMRDDIYTIKLLRRGIDVKASPPSDPMANVTVQQVMTTEVDTLPESMPLERVVGEFQRTGHHGFPVVDRDGLLAGVITLSDLEVAAQRGMMHQTVGDAATRDVMVCTPRQTLREALSEPAAGQVGRLPVVDPDNPRRLLGVLRRSDIIRAYASAASAGVSPDLPGDPGDS